MNEYMSNDYFRLIISIFAFVFGSSISSFFRCYIYRRQHNMSIVKGRSVCDNCGHVLNAIDLIPILGYVINRGKCRYCGQKIDIKYAVTELIAGSLFFIIVYRFGHSILTLKYIVMLIFGIYCSLCDLENYIINDKVIYIAAICRFALVLFNKDNPGEELTKIGTSVINTDIVILAVYFFNHKVKNVLNTEFLKNLLVLNTYTISSIYIYGMISSVALLHILYIVFRKNQSIPYMMLTLFCYCIFILL